MLTKGVFCVRIVKVIFILKIYWLKYRQYISLAAGIVLCYGVLFALGITCPIKFLLGVSCPGCGMSRALFSAVRLDFSAAFAYHPMWITLPFFAFFLLLFYQKDNKRMFRATFFVFAALMIGVYVYRMVCNSNEAVVVFDPLGGAIAKLFFKIKDSIV